MSVAPEFKVKKVTMPHLFNGAGPVVVDIEAGEVSLASSTYTANEWLKRSDKITEAFQKGGHLPKPEAGTRGFGAHPFLISNLRYINSQERGLLRRAPWWLRWFCDGVVGKERLHEM